jgi:hypothetical protein
MYTLVEIQDVSLGARRAPAKKADEVPEDDETPATPAETAVEATSETKPASKPAAKPRPKPKPQVEDEPAAEPAPHVEAPDES